MPDPLRYAASLWLAGANGHGCDEKAQIQLKVEQPVRRRLVRAGAYRSASDKRVLINGRAGSHPARLFFPGCRNMICVSAEAAGWIAAVVLALVLVSAVIALGRRFSR